MLICAIKTPNSQTVRILIIRRDMSTLEFSDTINLVNTKKKSVESTIKIKRWLLKFNTSERALLIS